MTKEHIEAHAAYLYAIREQGLPRGLFNQAVRHVTHALLWAKHGIRYGTHSWMDDANNILASGIRISDAARAMFESPAQHRDGVDLHHCKEVKAMVEEIMAANSIEDVVNTLQSTDFIFLTKEEHRHA